MRWPSHGMPTDITLLEAQLHYLTYEPPEIWEVSGRRGRSGHIWSCKSMHDQLALTWAQGMLEYKAVKLCNQANAI